MGKRKGAAIRAKQRGDAAATKLVDQQIQNEESSRFESKSNTELFVLDTTPDAAVTRAMATKKKKLIAAREKKAATPIGNIKQSKKHRISKMDERQIRQIMQRHSSEGVRDLAASNRVRLEQRGKAKRIAGTAKANYDLWAEAPDVTNQKGTKIMPFTSGGITSAGTAPIEFRAISRSAMRKDIQQPAKVSNKLLKAREALKKKSTKSIQVELAQPGQSYRPDEEQHQDVIGEALGIELRRKEALDYRNTPIGGGKMSDETLAILAVGSDDESSDDGGEDDNHDGPTAILKRKEKFTRAQRNKQKRVKAEQTILVERKRAKRLLNAVNESKTIAKAVRKEELILNARREEIDALKSEKRSQPIGSNVIANLSILDPINVPSLPVALTEELRNNGGGLRTVRPKGSLLSDRMESMVSRKMANRKKAYKKNVVEGKRRKMKGGRGKEFMLTTNDW
eukprot:CAMPEP_0198253108 /NCGR_PEP_ID=MMETSP1447-20131203/3567_1 /TAXON_ID=420782 /ORGANISM="Chaetoceros dichaeta, Strain CCMP1751" /LENGTH=452 /DNA_ID=CAMNT_0043938633 /DNA_START=29 /DNA_END=1387 /DNA_ORIENTATION=-